MKRRPKRRCRVDIKAVIALILIAIAIVMFLIFGVSKLTKKKDIYGTWKLDEITSYQFNKDNTGNLILSTGNAYAFTYQKDESTLKIDFEDNALTDTAFEYVQKDKELTLIQSSNVEKATHTLTLEK